MTEFFFRPVRLESLQSGACYGQFVLKDLDLGKGITIGNQLRRVLLGDVGGTSISAVKIVGLKHEFSTLPGIREDILEILLNLKGLVIESNTKDIKFGRLTVIGPLVVTADLIDLPVGLKVINPNHYIATISTETKLEMEFKIEYGTGYKLASQFYSEHDKDFIQLDTVFMPIQKVNFKIENNYDIKTSNIISENLFIEVWTDGSISPLDALKKSAEITVNLFSKLTKSEDPQKFLPKKEEKPEKPIEPYADIKIEELQLSIRSYNCLKKAKINTIAELLKYSIKELEGLRNFGKKSSNEVVCKLKDNFGIVLQKQKTS